MEKEKIPHQLKTVNNLGEEASQAIAKALNPLVADAFALYVKTKSFHWHLYGAHFRDYHLLFDEQAAQIFETIDVLAERVRKLGGLTVRSIGHISQLQTIKDDNDTCVAPLEMIKRLMEDNLHVCQQMRKAHEVCSKYKDIATTSLLEEFIDHTERRTWFLFEIQAEQG